MQEIIARLNDPDTQARIQAAAELRACGEAALRPLADALTPGLPEEMRWRAAAALGWMGDPRSLDALIGQLDGAEYELKFNLVWALGQLGSPDAIPALRDVVWMEGEKEHDIRYVAALSLARLGQADLLRASLDTEHEQVYRIVHAALETAKYLD
jgi:HEAT repeat protein